MSFEQVLLSSCSDFFSSTTELSSVALGGKVVALSDEFFAEAFHLLLVEAPLNLKGQFGSKGALYDGWETRRHNPSFDWCIVKLGTPGTVLGFDIDTTHFNGNEAQAASVEGLFTSSPPEVPGVDDSRWAELLPKVDLGPSARHLFKVTRSGPVNYIKLKIYPDGGIARFRVYGVVEPVFPKDLTATFDMAHVFAGGHVLAVSDQHFGAGSNLILPGRGKHMGDGWETKRNRQTGHNDRAIIRLGSAGFLEHAEIDTAHFMGNFPQSCELHAISSDTNEIVLKAPDEQWTPVLTRTKLGPHRRHFLHLENVNGKSFTHVRLTIWPDGGVMRVRIIGRRATGGQPDASNGRNSFVTDHNGTGEGQDLSNRENDHVSVNVNGSCGHVIPALPLTPEAFAPFGQVVQAYADHNAAPRGTQITPANQGTASKFHKLALIHSSYESDAGATAGLSVYSCNPIKVSQDDQYELNVLERHPYTNQAFIPMGGGCGDKFVDSGRGYLVVVSKNAGDGSPDLSTLRAFVATPAQGIVYNTAVWHQPMTVLGKPMDFVCVETQIGNGDQADCETLNVDTQGVFKVKIPGF